MAEPKQDSAPACEYPNVHEDAVAQVLAALPDDETLYDLSELFRVFGDSTRIKILYVLFESELCVCDIGAPAESDAVGGQPPAAHFEGVEPCPLPSGGEDRVLFPGRRPRPVRAGPRHGACAGKMMAWPSFQITFNDR